MWRMLFELRKAGWSPSAPVSRVFCEVGWPFICRVPQPGRLMCPRMRLTLCTWTPAAVAWFDWYTPCRQVDSSTREVPIISATRRRSAAGTPDIRCRPAPADRHRPSAPGRRIPSYAGRRRPGPRSRRRSRGCTKPLSTAPLLSSFGAKYRSASRAVIVRRRSITISPAGSAWHRRSSTRLHSTVSVLDMLWPTIRMQSVQSVQSTSK